MTSGVERYWEQFLASLPTGTTRPSAYAGAAAFGFTEDDAREIAPLVRNGTKTATGSLVWSSEADSKPGPRPGDLWMVIAGPDEPVCVIETTEVRVIPYDEVPGSTRGKEGKGIGPSPFGAPSTGR
ncbi:MAG: ASCH domain-containing protein [Thermoplasmata archaeon]